MPDVEVAPKADLLRRLRCTEGHLRGIATMVERDEEWVGILRQLQAVQRALREVQHRMVRQYLADCLQVGLQSPDGERRQQTGELITALYELL